MVTGMRMPGAGSLHETAAQKHRKVEAHGRQQRAHGKQAH